MKLADLQLATALQQQLLRLDEFAGPMTLFLADTDVELALSAEETADFVAWKRGRIEADLRQLGIDTGDSAPAPEARFNVAAGAIFAHNVTVAPYPAAPQQPLTYAEAYAEARERVIGAYASSQRVQSDDAEIDTEVKERLVRYEAHRKTDIEAMARDIMASQIPAESCSECAAPATTAIGALRYCDTHLASAPRPPRPMLVAAG